MKLFKKVLNITLFSFYITSTGCDTQIEVKSGEIKHISWTRKYAVGTDSTIVIIDMESGQTVNTIKRNK